MWLIQKLCCRRRDRRKQEPLIVVRVQPDLEGQVDFKWPALHSAALQGNAHAALRQLRQKADPTEQCGESLQLLPKEEGDRVLKALQQAAGSGVSHPAARVSMSWRLRQFDEMFWHVIGVSPLIGDRFACEEVKDGTGETIRSGLDNQLLTFRQAFRRLVADERRADAEELRKRLNCFADLSQDLKLRLQESEPEMLREAVIEAYTTESWIFPAVNEALAERSNVQTMHTMGLAPFVRLLHDTISEPTGKLQHWHGKSWRWVDTQHTDLRKCCTASTPFSNIFIIDGFASACKDPQRMWQDLALQRPGSEPVLFVIEPCAAANMECPPCVPTDISSCSAFPQEAEVLFPSAQQFKIVALPRRWTRDDLEAELGAAPPGIEAVSCKVWHIRPIDGFNPLMREVLRGRGAMPDALPIMHRRLSAMQRRHGENSLAASSAFEILGLAQMKNGESRRAEASLWQCLRIRLESFGPDHPATARSHSALARAQMDQGHLQEAEVSYQECARILHDTLGPQHIHLADCHSSLGHVHEQQGRLREAEMDYLECLRVLLFNFGPDHEEVCVTSSCLGGVLQKQGRFQEAMTMMEEALRIRLGTLGPDHLSVAELHTGIGGIHESTGRFRQAEASYRESLRIRLKSLGEDHPEVARSHNHLGNVQLEQELLVEAEASHRECLRILQRAHGRQHASVAKCHNNVGSVQERRGRIREAEGSYKQCLQILLCTLGGDHLDVAMLMSNLGIVQARQGRYLDAQASHKEAYRIRLSNLGRNHWQVCESQRRLDAVRQKQGDSGLMGRRLTWSAPS